MSWYKKEIFYKALVHLARKKLTLRLLHMRAWNYVALYSAWWTLLPWHKFIISSIWSIYEIIKWIRSQRSRRSKLIYWAKDTLSIKKLYKWLKKKNFSPNWIFEYLFEQYGIIAPSLIIWLMQDLTHRFESSLSDGTMRHFSCRIQNDG